jgi:hypothetical protein
MELASDRCSVKYSRLTVRMVKALSVSQESLEKAMQICEAFDYDGDVQWNM